MRSTENPYPPIADYALISDCHGSALVSRSGSIDWCCMPRVDSDSIFGRLLDWQRGGYCALVCCDDQVRTERRYRGATMILETRFETGAGVAILLDLFVMDPDADGQTRYQLLRRLECLSGSIDLDIDVCPRFDYGDIVPRMRAHEAGIWSAIGSDQGLVIHSDITLEVVDHCDLHARIHLQQGEKTYLTIRFDTPEAIENAHFRRQDPNGVDERLARTERWWQTWSSRMRWPYPPDPHTQRSALILKALTYERTGAIVAAPTTSLPEAIGLSRNWDYRFTWVRDSVFAIHALYQLGYEEEALRFLRFMQRTSAGKAEQLQIMYGIDGKRRLTEVELEWLAGYRNSRPVRIGNAAARQNQHDIYAEVLALASIWDATGHSIDSEYWQFLRDVIETVCCQWQTPDAGIWEYRDTPRHFVHSKAMCWAAIQRAIELATRNQLPAPLTQWAETAAAIRYAIETDGYDARRGIFRQAFDVAGVDAALLLLPRMGFIAYDDPRMLRTTDAICEELAHDGLIARYHTPDGLPPGEGTFLPCTFWLASCLAYQGRTAAAWRYYRRALACANDVHLFAEEFDPVEAEMLGNFPQGLTHVSQITARIALEACRDTEGSNDVQAQTTDRS